MTDDKVGAIRADYPPRQDDARLRAVAILFNADLKRLPEEGSDPRSYGQRHRAPESNPQGGPDQGAPPSQPPSAPSATRQISVASETVAMSARTPSVCRPALL
jgi:hypothetical protein